MIDILSTVLYAGIGAGIIAAGGYLKNTKKEAFDVRKFLKTILLGIAFSIGAELSGLSPDTFASSAIGVSLGTAVENWFKAFNRKVLKK